MREDTLHKVQTIANNLGKSEKVLMADEKKNLRFLERVGGMQKALVEDSETVTESLRHADRLRERA